MKVFEFRVYNIKSKKLINNYKGILPTNDDKYIIMQFIGIDDKNNKKIYEGDILIQNEEYWIVEYCNTCGAYELAKYENKRAYEIGVSSNMVDDIRWHDYEIVGNICENIDILEKAWKNE